jgi:transcriptional regulator with XRE-family HTH domain
MGIPEGPLKWAALANFVNRCLEQKGWDDVDLVRESGISAPTVWRILKAKPHRIKLQTFVVLAQALDVELWEILEVAGYPIEKPSPPAEADLRFAERLARQLDAFPELRPIVTWLFELPDADRRAVIAFLTTLREWRDPP